LICGFADAVGGVAAVCDIDGAPERAFPQLGQVAVPAVVTVWQFGHVVEAIGPPRSCS
jgi:hypothetical protein